ncbi:helix-turn-helix domain-containing protein [Streptomyces niveiscabiei]|uniref:helix-turn-helix domain-containing protein n=1 Tax=Streptomyces niveiscabiei TaxID=164115 RepID=UPI000D14F48A|nr:helix-turn-helix domain-containing protein [Streptomyces niveiscabiei]
MASDEQQWPLAEIVGKRLKLFREERGVRQAEVAAAAAKWGLPWARSSIAALEAGTRNLSLEETLLLPLIVGDLGGWDQPLIEADTWISISSTHLIQAKHLPSVAALLTTPSVVNIDDTPLREIAFGVRSAEQDLADEGNLLRDFQMHAESEAWRLFCARLYPNIPHSEISGGANLGPDLEFVAKVAKRIENPNGGPASWGLINVLSYVLWGKSLHEERDLRSGEQGGRSDRAFQSVKGHVTRDLISELSAEAKKVWPELNGLFGELNEIWNDREALERWATTARRQANRLYASHRRVGESRNFEVEHPAESAALVSIGSFLAERRKEAGLSISEVAEFLMETPEIVDAIEDGEYLKVRSKGRLEKLIRAFARVVGVPHEPILEEIEEARNMDRGDL